MACTPLNIQNGLFINTGAWANAPSANFDGKTLTLANTGPNPGLSVQQGAKSVFHAQLAGRTLRYQILGGRFLLILDLQTGAGATTRYVSLVNFSTWTEVPILTVTANSSAVALPIANPSQGNGSVFLVYGQDGTQHTSVGIRRSDNGQVLCALGTPITPTGQTAAEATGTQLIIHYNTANVSRTLACPKPSGSCQITPAVQQFADRFVGGCAFAPETKQFTVRNVGSDCLAVNGVSGSGPFSVQSTSSPLPVILATNETVSVTVAFNPTTQGNWPSASLPVATAPASGDSALVCAGRALPAEAKIGFSPVALNFGQVPVGTTAPTRTVTISNTGSQPLNVNVPALAVAGFSCAGFSGVLNCGQSHGLAVNFAPAAQGAQAASLSVTSNAPGSPHSISLTGTGCVPAATMDVPNASPRSFGQVQQGFRTVLIVDVLNDGNGPLTFTGTIGGPDAALFGLPDPVGSVTDAPLVRQYSVLPQVPCGPTASGSGATIVPISFLAGAAPPKLATATLTLATTNVQPPQTRSISLSAEIVPPVALDAALVIDRSGSMNDALGARRKMDVAVSASQLFVELLRSDLDDRVAVVRFNHTPEPVVPMTPVTSATPPTKADVHNAVSTALPPPDGNTAIAGGALVGIREIRKPRATTPAALTRALVVLTDGIENTGFEDPAGSNAWFSIRGGEMSLPLPATGTVQTNPMPRPADIAIYAVGVGTTGQIKPAELQTLAGDPARFRHVDQELTGTRYFELERYFTKIFMDVVGKASVVDPMYWISPGETQEIEFDVLRGDVDALIVLFDLEGRRLPFSCTSPTGEILDPATIPAGYQLRFGATSQTRIVEFKMPANEPDRYAGRWKVSIEHPGRTCSGMPPDQPTERGFLPRKCRKLDKPILYGIAIGVGSNFRMTPFVTPGPVEVGEPILLTALVSEAGLPVTGADVRVEATSPDGATWMLHLLDDGAHADGAADDGEYGATFTHTLVEGTYHFHFTARAKARDGAPVTREAMRDKPVEGRPTDPPPDDHCCEELREELAKQSKLLRRIAKQTA